MAFNILEQKKQEIQNQKNRVTNVIKSHESLKGINSFGTYFWGITGALLVIGGMPGVGIAFLSNAAANYLTRKDRGQIEKNKLELLNKEEEHIKKVTENPIDGSREMTARRVAKVNELTARKKEVSNQRKNAELGSKAATLFQWLSLAAAVCVPSVGWVSAIALGAKYLAGKKKIETAKEDDKLALRVNNLNLDLELTKAKAPSPRAAGVANCERVVNSVNNKKVNQKAPNTLDDEMLVEKYVESLDGIGEEENIKQLVK